MTRRRKTLLCVLCGVIAVAAVCFFCLREKEPSYNGRTLSEWLDRWQQSIPPGRSWPSIEPIDATDAIRHLAVSNGPLLAHWMVDSGNRVEQIGRLSGGNAFLMRIARFADNRLVEKFNRGYTGLLIAGTNARTAVPILKGALNTNNPITYTFVSNVLLQVAPRALTNK